MIYYTEQAAGATQRETAQKLLLWGLRTEYGIKKLPQIERKQQGKPYFPEYPEIRFNYSHSKGRIVCGIAETEIGVDIERRIKANERLVRQICHERERKLFETAQGEQEQEWLLTRFWTAKESYLKCIGTGLRVALTSLDFSACIEGGRFRDVYEISFCERGEYGIAVCSMRTDASICNSPEVRLNCYRK